MAPIVAQTPAAPRASAIPVFRRRVDAPTTARYAIGTTSGSAYRLVNVSWNRMSNTRYGTNATASSTSEERAVRYITASPAPAAISTPAANGQVAHGATNP